MTEIEKSPFHIVVNVVKGEGPDFFEGSPVDVPSNAVVIGTLTGMPQMIACQALFNSETVEKTLKSLEKKNNDDRLNPDELVKSIVGLSSRGCVMGMLVDLFWEGVFSTLPQGDRWMGDLIVCKGWQVVGIKDKIALLPDIALPSKKAISRFFDIFVSICKGNIVYDDTIDFPEKAENEISVGVVELNLLRQMFIMARKFRSVFAEHDPYPGFTDEFFFFKERPFMEYAVWRHASNRLKRMVRILDRMTTLGVMSIVDVDQPIIHSFISHGESGINIGIRKNWEIVLVRG